MIDMLFKLQYFYRLLSADELAREYLLLDEAPSLGFLFEDKFSVDVPESFLIDNPHVLGLE